MDWGASNNCNAVGLALRNSTDGNYIHLGSTLLLSLLPVLKYFVLTIR